MHFKSDTFILIIFFFQNIKSDGDQTNQVKARCQVFEWNTKHQCEWRSPPFKICVKACTEWTFRAKWLFRKKNIIKMNVSLLKCITDWFQLRMKKLVSIWNYASQTILEHIQEFSIIFKCRMLFEWQLW